MILLLLGVSFWGDKLVGEVETEPLDRVLEAEGTAAGWQVQRMFFAFPNDCYGSIC
jgi:hypothetical protein